MNRKLSYTPINLAFLYYLSEDVPIIITEVTVKSGDGLVQGYQLNLEVEWACKTDMIRSTVLDRCTRYVNRDQLLDLDYNENPKQPDDPLVTCFAYDEVHQCILMGTANGILVRFFYQRDGKRQTPDNESRFARTFVVDSANPSVTQREVSLPGKLMWCLEGTSITQMLKLTEQEDSEEPAASISVQKTDPQAVLNKVVVIYIDL